MLVEEFSSSRMSCPSPIYSCRGWTRLLVIGQRMSFWHLADCDWFLHLTETTTSFGHVASPCWSWMPSHRDTWHEFGLQGEMNLGFEFNKMDLFICKTQINHSTQINMDLIQILYEFNPIKFVCLQMPPTSSLVEV